MGSYEKQRVEEIWERFSKTSNSWRIDQSDGLTIVSTTDGVSIDRRIAVADDKADADFIAHARDDMYFLYIELMQAKSLLSQIKYFADLI